MSRREGIGCGAQIRWRRLRGGGLRGRFRRQHHLANDPFQRRIRHRPRRAGPWPEVARRGGRAFGPGQGLGRPRLGALGAGVAMRRRGAGAQVWCGRCGGRTFGSGRHVQRGSDPLPVWRPVSHVLKRIIPAARRSRGSGRGLTGYSRRSGRAGRSAAHHARQSKGSHARHLPDRALRRAAKAWPGPKAQRPARSPRCRASRLETA